MAVYSIKDLEKLSGVKAHTIRIWEQRYKLLAPKRTDTNIRYYLDDDLRRLLNVTLLKKSGLKISKIANMDEVLISNKVKELSGADFENKTQLDALTIAMIDMDENNFNTIISSNIKELGVEQTILKVIYPFLDKLNLLWLTGSVNPIQESFTSYLIRQKLIAAIDQLPMAHEHAKKFMVYIPEGEMQELSILFIHFILKSRGFKVIYLGQNVSLDDLHVATSIQHPDYIFSMISKPFNNLSLQEYVDQSSTSIPDVHWLFTGFQVASQHLTPHKNTSILTGLNDMMDFLSRLS